MEKPFRLYRACFLARWGTHTPGLSRAGARDLVSTHICASTRALIHRCSRECWGLGIPTSGAYFVYKYPKNSKLVTTLILTTESSTTALRCPSPPRSPSRPSRPPGSSSVAPHTKATYFLETPIRGTKSVFVHWLFSKIGTKMGLDRHLPRKSKIRIILKWLARLGKGQPLVPI
jgi:hypothetical protein